MASSSLQILRYNLSGLPVSHPGKPSWFPTSSRHSSRHFPTTASRFTVLCAARDSDKETNGEEPPESLFTKELRRRGMNPNSLLEDRVGGGAETGKEGRAFSQRNAVSTEVERSIFNQRERSMLLNSEGLEGLIPRARLLLTIGGTFFLGFWPLILITIAFFAALYFYFGPAFIHDASKTPVPPPQYIDPYALLEEERISQIAPRVN